MNEKFTFRTRKGEASSFDCVFQWEVFHFSFLMFPLSSDEKEMKMLLISIRHIVIENWLLKILDEREDYT